jgi:histidinol-phosphate aminotransferase
LVVDDAYFEYMLNKDYRSGLELFKNQNNVFILRTFSKIYGLASLRVGWGYGSKKIVDALYKIKPPFNVNKIAQECAVESLKDKSFIKKSVKHNLDWARKIKKIMNSYSIQTNEIGPNFFLLDFKRCKLNASFVERNLEKSGIILREMNSYGIKNCLRLTIGNVKENILLIKQMKKIFKNV